PARRRCRRALATGPRGRGGKEHSAPGARGAGRGGDAAARRHRRGGEAGPLVCRRQGAGVRERRAGRRRPRIRRTVRILLVNWNDRENPHAGGAEIHLHEIFGRLVQWGHGVDLVTSGWPGGARETVLDGMRVHRRAAFHAISDSTRDDLVRRGIRRERVEVIYPGVDAAWYSPDAAVPRAATPTFLYVGRLKRYKGVETAVRAVALARAARPDVTLEIAGQGDDRVRLERLAGELGQGDAVRFFGFVSEEAKRRLLRRAWAVVLPSPKEGWGISNVEAAACGTPALAA